MNNQNKFATQLVAGLLGAMAARPMVGGGTSTQKRVSTKKRGMRRTGAKAISRRKRGTYKIRRTTTVSLNRRRRGITDVYGTEASQRNLVTSKRWQMKRLVAGTSLPDVYRFQNLSRYDTTCGAIPCSLRINVNDTILPIHVYDLTRLTQHSDADPAGSFLYKTGTGTGWTAHQSGLYGQNPDGTITGNTKWWVESGTNPYMYAERAFHDYTQIKLNLYGVRTRATRWMIQLVQIKDETADFYNAAGTNHAKKQLYDWLSSPYVYNNLNVGDTMTGRQYYKVVRQYDVTLDAMDTTVGAVENDSGTLVPTGVPRIHTLKWFVRHNRVRQFDWERSSAVLLENGAEWPQNIGTVMANEQVDPTKRLYLVIRALSPVAKSADMSVPYNIDPDTEPSYDILLRNKWHCP